MFFLTLKLPRPRFLTGAMAALCLLAATVPLSSSGSDSVSAGVVQSAGQRLHSNGERVDFLRSLGWEVREKPLSEETLLLPDVLPETAFLALQREQGFDLSALTGQRIKRYVYFLKNHPSGSSEDRAALLLFQQRVVGGAVYSLAPHGKLRPLLME